VYRLKKGERFCYNHDPARAEERRANGAKRRRPGDLDGPLGTLDEIARRAAKLLEQLEKGILVEELLGEKVTEHLRLRVRRELGVLVALEPSRANSMLAALRFLAQLDQLRRALKAKKASPSAAGGEVFDLEQALG